MKSYNNLFNKMIQSDQIKDAIKLAAIGKEKRSQVEKTFMNLSDYIIKIQNKIINETWHPYKHKKHILKEGSHKKMREIEKPFWDQQIIHHMLMKQFRTIFLPKMYYYACGSVPDKGTHFVAKTIKKWKNNYQNKDFYVAQLDIKKFYDNIDLFILKQKLSNLIRDKKYLRLLFKIIDCGGPGLPKGFYSSPWLAHFYLTNLDYFIVQQLHLDHYIRFMDNMWLFSTNKKELHQKVEQIKQYLKKQLHLTIKKDWQVFKFQNFNQNKQIKGRPINAVGFVIHRNRVGLRKSILQRFRAKVNRLARKKKITLHDACSVVSYMGYIKYTDSYNYYKTWIKPKVSIRQCKNIIASHAKQISGGN